MAVFATTDQDLRLDEGEPKELAAEPTQLCTWRWDADRRLWVMLPIEQARPVSPGAESVQTERKPKMLNQIYLAARYSRRLELCGYAEELQPMGFSVRSRWLAGNHQIDPSGVPIGEDGRPLVEDNEAAAKLCTTFASEDLEDVVRSDILIAFTEAPRSAGSRGGRHVELGLAIGMKKKIIVVGPRENLFCFLPSITRFETWDQAKGFLFRLRGLTQYLSDLQAAILSDDPSGATDAR